MPSIHSSTFEAAMTLVREHVARHPMAPEDLPDFIKQVHASVLKVALASVALVPADVTEVAPVPVAAAAPQIPAVPVEASVFPDRIICLEDGSEHKMMKRYLMRVFGMTPQQYRAKWGLPANYPTTAPGYSEVKRREAAAVGLGTKENKRGGGGSRGRDAMAA